MRVYFHCVNEWTSIDVGEIIIETPALCCRKINITRLRHTTDSLGDI